MSESSRVRDASAAGRAGFLPRFAVRRPVTTSMIFIAIVTLGAVGFTRLAVDLFPSVDMPNITVMTEYYGVGAEEIETLITRPIEEALATLQNLDSITAFSSEGRSRVLLRFSWDTNLDSALGDIRAALERVRSRLPEDASQPMAFKFDLSAMPVMFISLSSDGMDPRQLRNLAEQRVKIALERVEGVARVDVRGGLRREIHVDLLADRLSAYGVSADTIINAIRRENRDIPGGSVYEGDKELIIKTVGELRGIEQLESVIVAHRPEGPVRLSDLARIRDAAEERRNLVWIDGADGIRMSVNKLDGSNTVDVARRLREEIVRLDERIEDANLRILTDTAELVEASVASVQNAAIVGGLLAVLVLFIFLGDIRATLIIATAIPISVIGTFALMDFAGITLNIISFGGLALGIGMLVDSAIVILENIFRHREANPDMDPAELAVEGSREVASAVTASTMTTLTVFIPVVFLGGFVGIFFEQLAMVVVFSLVCALMVAMTLVPMLASKLPRSKTLKVGGGPIMRTLESGYSRFVSWLLNHKWVALVLALSMVGGSYFIVSLGWVGTELMPETDEGSVRITVELPPGTRLEVTERVMAQMEKRVREAVPETEVIFINIGPRGMWSSAGTELGVLNVELVDLARRNRSSADIAASLRPLFSDIPDATVRIRAGGGLWIFRVLRGGGDRLQVDIRGHDLRTGTELAAEIAELMRSVSGVAEARSSSEVGAAELGVHVDWERASAMGLSPSMVGQVIQHYILGTNATYLREEGDEFPVVVRLSEHDRRYVEQVLDLPIFTPNGRQIPIRSVASLREQAGANVIQREEQERVIYVTGTLSGPGVDLGSVAAEVERRLQSEIVVPPGFVVSMGGESREQQQTFSGLLMGLLLALALVYMVMAAQFESLVQPFIIMFAVPLASIGVVVSLVVTGTSFNMYSFLGVIVLVGIVVNNAIVLVDYMNLLRREKGLSVREAVVDGTRRRLRPIIMTTTTTSLALIPVAMGWGEGGDLNAPLARVVVGGLISATLISLVVVPAVYSFIEEIRANRKEKKVAAQEPAASVAVG